MKNLISIFFLLGVTICAATADNIPLCESKITLKCIQHYFAKHGLCAPKTHKQNVVKYRGDLHMRLPSIGVDTWTTETTLSHFEGVPVNFEKDPVTENILLGVDFSEGAIQCDAPNTVFAFRKDEEEPLVLKEYVDAFYPAKFAVTIPTFNGKIDRWSLKNAKYAAFFDKEAKINIGPKVTENQDPVVQKSLQGLAADMETALKEMMDTKASYLFLLWLQANVCDFKESPVLEKSDMTVVNSLRGIKVDESKLPHPCDGSDDLTKCTRAYFAKKASCNAVQETSAGPVNRQPYVLTLPLSYADVKLYDVNARGLDGEVTHMHVNEETGNLMIALNFKKLIVNTHKLVGFVKEFGAMAKAVNSTSTHTYENVNVTGVVNIKKGLNRKAIENAYVIASTDRLVKTEYGNEITDNKALAGVFPSEFEPYLPDVKYKTNGKFQHAVPDRGLKAIKPDRVFICTKVLSIGPASVLLADGLYRDVHDLLFSYLRNKSGLKGRL